MSNQIVTKRKKKEYIPYTYAIGWSEIKKYYYGVQYGRKANPSNLWTTYFTSSNVVKEYRKLYGEPDIIKVSKTFKEADDAINWEQGVLKKLLSSKNPNRENWINVCITYGNYFQTDEHRKSLSLSRKRYIKNRTLEQKERDYQARLIGASNVKGKKTISDKAKERFSNPEYRKHFRDNIWDNPNNRELLRQNTTEWLSDPIRKEKWLKTVQSEDYRARQGKDSKERYLDEEYKKRWIESIRISKENDPDYYIKKSENSKKSTGTRLASGILNKLTKEYINSHSDDELIEVIKTKIKEEYRDNMNIDKLLNKIKILRES